jgi:FkbM family methyltransferase
MWLKVEPYWEPGYVGGVPEPGVPAMIEKFLKPGDCFYDVGAHVGFYSLLAARLVGEAGRVIALEPDADNVAVLNEVVARNNLKHVRVARTAVWDSDGEVTFERGLDAPSRMGGRVAETSSAQNSPSEMVSVPAVALDTLAAADRPPSVIKIDVEGGEKQVLQGARRVLEVNKPVLVVEIHVQESTEEVSRMLSAWGYKLHSVHPTGVKVHACFVV